MAAATRSATSGLTPEQQAAVLAAFGGDQAVATRMIGINLKFIVYSFKSSCSVIVT